MVSKDSDRASTSNIFFAPTILSAISIASKGIVTATNQFVAGSTSGAHVMLNSTGSIEMVRTTGSADPFIDFKDSASDDFDVRLQMDDNKFIVKTVSSIKLALLCCVVRVSILVVRN